MYCSLLKFKLHSILNYFDYISHLILWEHVASFCTTGDYICTVWITTYGDLVTSKQCFQKIKITISSKFNSICFLEWCLYAFCCLNRFYVCSARCFYLLAKACRLLVMNCELLLSALCFAMNVVANAEDAFFLACTKPRRIFIMQHVEQHYLLVLLTNRIKNPFNDREFVRFDWAPFRYLSADCAGTTFTDKSD